MALKGSTDNDKLADLTSKNYKAQAVWFLNAFWHDFASKEAENIFLYKNKFEQLDPNKAEGTQLDEMNAHRFLEQINSTMTIAELREFLRTSGVDKVKYVPLVHFLLARFKANLHKLVTAVQGDNQAEIEKAQNMLETAQAALAEAQKKAAAAAASEAELKAALAELHAQEDAFKKKTDELTKKTTEGGVVGQNKAKAELAAHLASDPLPLNRAKLNTEAATKKAEKARAEAEAALEEAQKRFAEADKYLAEVTSRSGSAQGALWWINKELQEAKKYIPQKKGGVGKSLQLE
jgi:DNA repair exonuclease SbcCD ATPase subunit